MIGVACRQLARSIAFNTNAAPSEVFSVRMKRAPGSTGTQLVLSRNANNLSDTTSDVPRCLACECFLQAIKGQDHVPDRAFCVLPPGFSILPEAGSIQDPSLESCVIRSSLLQALLDSSIGNDLTSSDQQVRQNFAADATVLGGICFLISCVAHWPCLVGFARSVGRHTRFNFVG
jgi:hypothetical protein